jgi:hypothetical protein
MRSRFSIFVFIALVVALLAALNAASYLRVEREPELESNPDRSTTNAGPTGTRAVYEYLEATGHKVARWRESADALLDAKPDAKPSTFVVIGALRRQFTEAEKKSLMRWVARGGRLVVIDRIPEETLERGARWGVASSISAYPGADSRADDVEKLTAGISTVAPTQPTLVASAVERVAPSRYASRLRVVGRYNAGGKGDDKDAPAAVPPHVPDGDPKRARDTHTSNASDDNAARDAQRRDAHDGTTNEETSNSSDDAANSSDDSSDDEDEEPPPPPKSKPTPRAGASPQPSAPPPVVVAPSRRGGGGPAGVGIGRADAHPEDRAEPDAPVLNFSDERGALVAEYTRGRGRIIVVSDPFIVANNGIARADNLQLATNVITPGGGLIAFDEYHQGRGSSGNEIVNYFAGTPVVAMFCQFVLIAAVVAYSRGRRFARAVPAQRPDRRSKLEFVASMAELQQRARAFDLALENIYSRTRRALARYGGTDINAPRAEIAAAVAARSGQDRARIEQLMRDCEDAAAGEPTPARRALALAAQLRELERALGIRMREREIKQAERL